MTLDPLNRLCKWRSVLAGWHAGTRSMSEPGTQAMRDLMDKWLVMRAENNAIAKLLIEKQVFSDAEFAQAIQAEAFLLDKALEKQFPGFRTSDNGMVIDVQVANATMKKLGFPP